VWVDSLSLPELCSGLPAFDALPFHLFPSGASFFPFFRKGSCPLIKHCVPCSFAGRHIQVGSSHIFKIHLKELELISKKIKKYVADRFAKPIDESPNHLGELDRAHRKDWLKNSPKKWHVGDEKGLLVNRRHHSASTDYPAESYSVF